jgi:hypothetical protein
MVSLRGVVEWTLLTTQAHTACRQKLARPCTFPPVQAHAPSARRCCTCFLSVMCLMNRVKQHESHLHKQRRLRHSWCCVNEAWPSNDHSPQAGRKTNCSCWPVAEARGGQITNCDGRPVTDGSMLGIVGCVCAEQHILLRTRLVALHTRSQPVQASEPASTGRPSHLVAQEHSSKRLQCSSRTVLVQNMCLLACVLVFTVGC